MTRCAVYDLLVDGAVIYVGSTTDTKTRLYAHRCRKEFKAARLRIYAWYGSVLRAQISESNRIAALRPKYNVACNPDVRASWFVQARKDAKQSWLSSLENGVSSYEADRKYEQRLKQLVRLEGKP